jgi:hypothetical protein
MKETYAFVARWLALLILIASPLIGGVRVSGQELVTICHNPGPNEVTMKVNAAAVEVHEAHGDIIGSPCADVVAQCTDGWTAEHTDNFAVYLLEVDRETLEGRATYIRTVDRADHTLHATVTSLSSGEVWRFEQPSCGSTECGYLLGWYGGTTHSIGEGAGTYEIVIHQAQEGLVRLHCRD